MQSLRIKAGDTLAWQATRTDAAGDPVPLAAVSISAHFADRHGTITPTASVLDAAAGRFELTAPATETAGWAPGAYRGDVTFTDGLGAQSTETFAVIVEQSYP
jgi:hypothetical protein